MNRAFILNDDDVIQAGDFARPLDLVYDGLSDYLPLTNTYSGDPENHTRWCQIERLSLERWIGNTVKELNDAMWRFIKYEFCRGDLGPGHILPETENEREARIRKLTMTKGKYKGASVGWVEANDRSYYYWLVNNGILQRMIDASLPSFYSI